MLVFESCNYARGLPIADFQFRYLSFVLMKCSTLPVQHRDILGFRSAEEVRHEFLVNGIFSEWGNDLAGPDCSYVQMYSKRIKAATVDEENCFGRWNFFIFQDSHPVGLSGDLVIEYS